MALTIEFPTDFHDGPLAAARDRAAAIGRSVWVVAATSLVLVAALMVWNVGALASEPEMVEPSGVNVVVGPGDTYWSIAEDSMSRLDRRSAVADLTALNGPGPELRVGDVVAIPASG